MMMKKALSCLAVVLVAGATVIAGEVKLEGVKCVVADRDAKASKSADYKDAKVYFCCGGCQGKFAKNPEKYSNSANRQLVASKQYEQKACPLSGGKINPKTAIKVADTKVAFCCNNCKGKVAAAEGEKQIALVFSEKAFKKAFKKAEKEEDDS